MKVVFLDPKNRKILKDLISKVLSLIEDLNEIRIRIPAIMVKLTSNSIAITVKINSIDKVLNVCIFTLKPCKNFGPQQLGNLSIDFFGVSLGPWVHGCGCLLHLGQFWTC